jgi:cytochrome c oxidase subunit 4
MPEHAGRHSDPHADPHAQPDHIVPLGTYILVFLALMVGTAVTVAASYVDLGIWNTPVAMLIAVTKASLVVFFFMHLKYSPRLYWIWLGAAVFFVAHLLLGTGLDYLARAYLNLGNPGT